MLRRHDCGIIDARAVRDHRPKGRRIKMTSNRRDLFFEDFNEGEAFETPGRTITEEEMVDFGMKYDPQPFHVDKNAARSSIFGGLIASGIHTMATTLKLLLEEQIFNQSSLGSLGLNQVRWPRPVRPLDTLRARLVIAGKRLSSKKPDRGYVDFVTTTLNQNDEVVMTMNSTQIVRLRSTG
jgi:acyl dehydratase